MDWFSAYQELQAMSTFEKYLFLIEWLKVPATLWVALQFLWCSKKFRTRASRLFAEKPVRVFFYVLVNAVLILTPYWW